MAIDWYREFVDLDHTPGPDELVALYYFEPAAGISREEAVGRIASESSTGTWTTLFTLPPRMRALQAKAFEIEGNYVKIAYPLALWEEGNAAQLLSGIAGNVFGMKALDNLRLIDVSLPAEYLRHFKGPHFGIEGIRDMMKVRGRPLTGAVPKPKVGFTAEEHAEVGYETWMGGFDFVKDDENLTSLSFNRFEDRVRAMAKMRDRAEQETGERKSAFINITADTETMKKRAEMLADYGWNYAMIDVVVAGTAAVATLRDYCSDLGLAIHAHRAMHAAFDRTEKHGITMQFLAKVMRLIGVSQIHTGTAVGKLVGTRAEATLLADILREKHINAVDHMALEQDWGKIKNAFPVSSGGLHPGLVPDVLDIYGTELVLLVSGGIHGHPKGTRAGAEAVMQAIEAWKDGETLEEKAKKAPALAEALEKWGYYKPK
ncbi:MULTISPECIES: type III ribulose-bisphosphate carboxylase [Methanoculleus]|mgnify:FL=1|jgi:ribulose-bisphosphate carboxylase large chain|uniref:Ribulose bisphosphate carboxylase n=1 Tax=Methanoculleus thermophilus TaxID=2200 RepID=A0A1G9ASP4_9EURY|nr:MULTISPECIES: type III ribulose-bisphosphate carboxylase [Methanoculleus]NLN08652.1 type III ribulose-bisphosphate carboxylase [Methanoculleus thermophilus]SDK30253.1 ribulose-1,5-bisphosphate carboxylase/oxygenase large subunit [Methanoculleus thermophilus]HQD25924.1 type III ribulose-bisphosphate carboxylase [Methanoculleus thermophilus]